MKKALALILGLNVLLLTAGCVPLAGPSVEQQDEWGIVLSAQDVTPRGMTLVCDQSGGNAAGDLQTGSPFAIERLVDGEWVAVNTVPGILDWAWTMEAWAILRDSTARWEVDWDFLYGGLASGTYRISKVIMDFRGPGDYTEQTYYAEFAVTK